MPEMNRNEVRAWKARMDWFHEVRQEERRRAAYWRVFAIWY